MFYLFANGEVADAAVVKTVANPGTICVTAKVYVCPSMLAMTAQTGDFVQIAFSDGGDDVTNPEYEGFSIDPVLGKWVSHLFGVIDGPDPITAGLHEVVLYLDFAGGVAAYSVDGVGPDIHFDTEFVALGNYSAAWLADEVRFGQKLTPAVSGDRGFFSGVWIGDSFFTENGSVYSDDFSGDLSGFDGQAGDVSIVPTVLCADVPPPTSQPLWTVEHYQHEYVPDGAHSSTLEADGSLIQIVRPENLHFLLQLGELGPGAIDYEVSRHAKNDDDSPVVTEDFVGPYRTDWLLKRSDLDDPIMGGIHTEVGGQDGETPMEAVQIAGKDWLHYLEHRVWPYDATLSGVDWPDGFRFKVTGGEVCQIVKDVLETVRDLSANYPAAPDVLGPNPSYSLGFTVEADDTGVDINHEITPFDATSIFQRVQTLSQMGKTRGGFDFYATWDKIIKLVAPEIGDPGAPIFALHVDATNHLANMLSAGFTNTGPEATHVLGVGAGTSTQQGAINKHFPASSAVFRRLDKIADFGDVKNLDVLESLTSLELAFGSNPVHRIPIEVDPRNFEGFWVKTRPGKYVAVEYDFGLHTVDSIQRIISMDCNVNQEGDERVVLAFNQFYDASDASGIDDW